MTLDAFNAFAFSADSLRCLLHAEYQEHGDAYGSADNSG
jgi:hypothetical protein